MKPIVAARTPQSSALTTSLGRQQQRGDDLDGQRAQHDHIDGPPGEERRRIVHLGARARVVAAGAHLCLAFPPVLPPASRFANSRYAPGTPAGSWRKNASPV